jgi:hypothetical protein
MSARLTGCAVTTPAAEQVGAKAELLDVDQRGCDDVLTSAGWFRRFGSSGLAESSRLGCQAEGLLRKPFDNRGKRVLRADIEIACLPIHESEVARDNVRVE